MPRGVKRQPQEPAKEPVAKAEPEAPEAEVVEVAKAKTVPEIKPEPKFGEDPDDLYGSDEVAEAPVSAPVAATGKTVSVVYDGLKVPKGAKADPGPIAVTITVPEDRDPDYERMVFDGITYTLHRGQPRDVAKDDVKWLTGHPAYIVAEAK